jgi:hypothetical protein
MSDTQQNHGFPSLPEVRSTTTPERNVGVECTSRATTATFRPIEEIPSRLERAHQETPAHVPWQVPASSDRVVWSPSFDRLCELCQRLFAGRGPRRAKSLRRLHHNYDALVFSAGSGCHLCSLMFVCIDKNIVRELQEDLKESSRSGVRNLWVTISIRETIPGDIPGAIRIDVLCSLANHGRRHRSLLDPSRCLSLLPGKNFTLQCKSETAGADLDRSPTGLIFINRVMGANSLGYENLVLVSKWIHICEKSHPLCRTARALRLTALPTRLLEISATSNNKLGVEVRLRHTKNAKDLHSSTKYMTLSHRWKNGIPRRLEENLTDYEKGIPVDILEQSPTFVNAAQFTLNLGCRHLWIDSLCIIQDSANRSDWDHESKRMCDVYAGSFLNLAAVADPYIPCGLAVPRWPLCVMPCQIRTRWADLNNQVMVCFDKTRWQGYVETELNSRGWVAQERLLSPRGVNFAVDQIYWECPSLRASECFPYGPILRQPDYDADKNIKSILVSSSETMNKDQTFHDTWNWILRYYTRTTLTNETDRQIALSGIVTMLSTLFNRDISDFIGGIWRPCLPYQLLWYVEGPCNDREASPQAPSWSWLSWGSSVEYHDTLPSSVPMISVLHINDHEVRLQGFICELTDLKYLEPTEQESIAKGSFIRTRDRIDLLLKSMEIYEELLRLEDGSLKENLFVCQVCSDAEFNEAAGEQIHGLVLEPTMVKRGHYRRVAYLNYLQKEIQMPERNLLTGLDQSLYQEFDEEKGYTFTIV